MSLNYFMQARHYDALLVDGIRLMMYKSLNVRIWSKFDGCLHHFPGPRFKIRKEQ